ncbi:hypothetical protein VRB95_08600 [Erwinia aphidicola]|uniref:hypothetical protein n=1 Tax=Erwinia aphidicola TaxID=68334 RepID=UPI0030CE75D0
MTQMIYRAGKMAKWKGVGYEWKIIHEDEVDDFLEHGWVAHPDELIQPIAEPEPEPEPLVKERKKPGPKPKAATDESDD